jgi:hypothetical protein
VGTKPFGIDLVLPASSPMSGTLEELESQIPETHREYAAKIKETYDVPEPKGEQALHQWGGLNQELARAQLDVVLEERVPVFTSGLGSPAFILERRATTPRATRGTSGRSRSCRRWSRSPVTRR